jgi:hypothetical protein
MARHAPVVEHAGNTVTVIAPTAEEAMALVGDAGPGFRTTSIGKVRRGGLAGFFATEMVRIVAEAAEGDGGRQIAPLGAAAPLQLATADDLIASLCGSDGPFAGRLAAGLQRSLHDPPATAPAEAPATAPVVPTPTDSITPASANIGAGDFWHSEPAPRGLTDERAQRHRSAAAGAWSAAALEAVGLPASLVGRIASVRPHDAVTWNAALMLAVRDWCGADLPPGAVLAGPACGDLAVALHIPLVDAADVADREGPVALPTASAAELCAAIGERAVHLVVGGAWRHLATVRPTTVSAATGADLVDAIRAAVAWDVPLGWVVDGGEATRIDPFVVAAHVRALLASDGPRIPSAAPAVRRTPTPRGSKANASPKPTARRSAQRAMASR